MLIGGLQKTTLIDFPGRVAATIFTVGCNFRCPFCHNKDLVTVSNFKKSSFKQVQEKELFRFLEGRKGILDGVCITGGEPTIQKDIVDFCRKLKDLSLEVKLDTNGTRPDVVDKLLKDNLVDYISVDVKNDFDNYQKAVGVKTNIEKVIESLKKIIQAKIEFELRTTVVPGIHYKANLEKLASQMKKLSSRSFLVLQNFQPQNCLDDKLCGKEPFTSKELGQMLRVVKKILPKSKIRGEG
jgi:pyruvate formate lyase activating enzyme